MNIWTKMLLQCLMIAMRLCAYKMAEVDGDTSFSWLSNAIHDLEKLVKEKQL